MGMKVVLLTGASGFIGGRIRPLLIERGYSLRLFLHRPDEISYQVESIVGDLTDIFACHKCGSFRPHRQL